MAKKVLAFFLGVVSFFMMFAIGEPLGAAAAFTALGIYYFICQLLLSRGNTRAIYRDWPLIFSLNAVMIVTAAMVLMILMKSSLHYLRWCLQAFF